MERPPVAAHRPRSVPGASYEFIREGEGDVSLATDDDESTMMTKENPRSAGVGGKPDYLKRMWYLAIAVSIVIGVICVFAGVAMGYVIAHQGTEAMESVRDMRHDTRQLHDTVMEGKKLADASMAGMVADAKDAIHMVADMLRKNPDTVQQALTQANLLATRVQELTAKFTPSQMDDIKQNIIDITRSTKDMMAALNPAVLNATLARFMQLSASAVDVMAKLQAENLLRDAAAFAEMGTSLGQRILDMDQIVVNLPRFDNKRQHV